MRRTVTCFCENTFDEEFAEEGDAAVSPDLEEEILSGRFMSARCPKCGKVLKPEFPYRFRDSARSVDVFMVPELDRGAYLRKAADYVPADVQRVVIGFPELVEKVRILNARLDDRVVEILKYHLMQKASEGHPDADIRIYFSSRGGGALSFDVHGIQEGDVGVVRVPVRTAEGVERDLPRILRQGTYKDFLKGPYVSCSTVSAENAGS